MFIPVYCHVTTGNCVGELDASFCFELYSILNVTLLYNTMIIRGKNEIGVWNLLHMLTMYQYRWLWTM